MSRYTCYNCKVEHGTDNMVAYCAACYSDIRSEFASIREVNTQLAEDAANLRAQEDIAVSAFDGMRLAKNRAEAAEAQVAALTEKVAGLVEVMGRFGQLPWANGIDSGHYKSVALPHPVWINFLCEVNDALQSTTPILAAHDAAKQAELVEALREVVRLSGRDHDAWIKARAILAKYPKAAKEGA